MSPVRVRTVITIRSSRRDPTASAIAAETGQVSPRNPFADPRLYLRLRDIPLLNRGRTSCCTGAWIARLDATGISVIERYRLDRATSQYKHVSTHMKDEAGSSPLLTNPIPLTIDWDELEY
jgi:hypothetical protein